MNTKKRILSEALNIFSLQGYEGLSMRSLAKNSGITPSVLYYHYQSKDSLLDELFKVVNTELGLRRANLKVLSSASSLLKQRIEFQLNNSKEIIAVLKYFIYFRNKFKRNPHGFVPEKASLHMEEVLELGRKTSEFKVYNLKKQAKIMTHSVNGFILEYFPHKFDESEKKALVNSLHTFIIRSLRK